MTRNKRGDRRKYSKPSWPRPMIAPLSRGIFLPTGFGVVTTTETIRGSLCHMVPQVSKAKLTGTHRGGAQCLGQRREARRQRHIADRIHWAKLVVELRVIRHEAENAHRVQAAPRRHAERHPDARARGAAQRCGATPSLGTRPRRSQPACTQAFRPSRGGDPRRRRRR